MTVNHGFCRRVRQSATSGLLICTALVALSLPIRAHAQFTGKASATAQFESNSNVFDLESGFNPTGTNDRSDTFFAYGAAFDARYSWGRQQIFATASTTEYEYQRFTELNHNGYNVDAGLIWKLGEPLDGKLDVTRTHSMVPFYNLTGSALALSLETEQKEAAQIGLKLGSEWKVEGSAYTSKTDQPVQNAPNLQLTETSVTTSIDYLGFGRLTSGLTAGYLSGDYSGSNGNLNPTYSQSTVGLLAKYKHTTRTIFEGQIGYSRRTSDTGSNSTSGVTGLLDLTHQLTPKTRYMVKIDRTINSYFLNAGSEIDTEAAASIDWQATYRTAVSVGYTFTYRNFPGQGNNPVGSDRVDIQEYATMGISYQPKRWLQIKPYANVQTRRSTFIGGHFSQTIFGVFVTVSPFTPYTPYRPK
jgi:hypothetical protein